MPADRLVLAFDTSAAHCAAALLWNDKILCQTQDEMKKGQAEHLFPLLDGLLKDQGFDWPQLTAIGVGIGPGNFTGIRISVAAARGLALSLKCPAIGVSSLQAQSFGQTGPVISTLDAKRDHVYFQTFNTGFSGAPNLCHIDNLDEISQHHPTLDTPTCVGFRNQEIAEHFKGHAKEIQTPIAIAIAYLAADQHDPPPQRPAPLYIRSADAAPPKDPAPVIID